MDASLENGVFQHVVCLEITHMAYSTVYTVSLGDPSPGVHLTMFLRFSEKKWTLRGSGGRSDEDATIKHINRYFLRLFRASAGNAVKFRHCSNKSDFIKPQEEAQERICFLLFLKLMLKTCVYDINNSNSINQIRQERFFESLLKCSCHYMNT